MKTKIVTNRKQGGTFLRVQPQKGVTLAFDQAYVLGLHPKDYLLPFKYVEKVDRVILDFDFQSRTTLDKALASNISFEQFFRVLNIVNNVLDLIVDGQFVLENVVFEPKYIFVDEKIEPKLMYLCVKGKKKEEFGVEQFVRWLIENAKFASKDDEKVVTEVSEHLSLQQTFSFFKFVRFVDSLSKKYKVLNYSYLANQKPPVNLGQQVRDTIGLYSFVNLETSGVASGE